jgi:hypothetical protein
MTIVQKETRLHGSTKLLFEAGGLSPETDTKKRVGAPLSRKEEVADYIYHISGELRTIARAAQRDMLVYFLDMARIEANTQRQVVGTMSSRETDRAR